MSRKPRLSFARYSASRRKRRRKQLKLAASAGLLALLIGGTGLAVNYSSRVEPWTSRLGQWTVWLPFHEQDPLMRGEKVFTPVLQLADTPLAERAEQLEAIAQEPESLDRARARYLLATDLIEQKQGEKALRWLDRLEWDYPILAGHIVWKRAQAYELTGDKDKALEAWQDLLKRYSNRPVAAQALYALLSDDSEYKEQVIAELSSDADLVERVQHAYAFSANNPKYWEVAIEKYPSHPRILELVQQRLEETPHQPQLMLTLARYGFDKPEIIPVLDRLVTYYGYSQPVVESDQATIQPEDWEVIALGYWRDRKYTQASAAYTNTPYTPRNAYLVALGLQYAEQPEEAKRAYKQMVHDFPNTDETASALLQLAKLEPDFEAVPYLDQVINQFPDQAGKALLVKAEIVAFLESNAAADEVRQLLLTKYGDSDAAAEYRWKVAWQKAEAGDLQAALEWAQPIATQNPDSNLARQAGFWAGKWASKLGHQEEAQAAFEQVIANHPQSYYAWRSAVMLGWDVGDFDTVVNLSPQVVVPAGRPELPAGSPALKELYQLGQDKDAWTLWQGEFQNRLEPTVAEQFTDGLMRLGMGNYLEGIARIAKLEDRETPQEQAEYQAIREKLPYWYALYPFPFYEVIETYSQQRQLNPLLVTALIRQESRFEPDIRSSAGAVGLMQMLPSTGDWAAQQLDVEQYSLENPNDNIKLGTWFFRQIHQTNNNNSLLAVASYNAGEGNLEQWLYEQGDIDDPDVFVETIPFEETENYVKQVFGNYWNYLQLYEPQVAQRLSEDSAVQSTAKRR